MKLVAGTPEHSETDRALLYLRRLGYSRDKTCKLMRISSNKLNGLTAEFGGFSNLTARRSNMHTKFKDKKVLLMELKRSIVDLGLHHGLDIEDIDSVINEVTEMVRFAKLRRKK